MQDQQSNSTPLPPNRQELIEMWDQVDKFFGTESGLSLHIRPLSTVLSEFCSEENLDKFGDGNYVYHPIFSVMEIIAFLTELHDRIHGNHCN